MFSDRHARHTPPTRPMDPVIIIGAGWAGLSAALHLRQAGVPVRVLEAAPQAGGRARRQVLSWPDTDGIALDNGQHLLLGAYRDTLDLVAWLDGQGMDRLPLRIENAAGLQLRRRRHVLAAGTPDSLSRQLAESLSLLAAVLTARGLSRGNRLQLVWTLFRARAAGWRPPVGVRTVAEWYQYTRQPARLVQQLWDPLVISAMNTPPALASATVFLRVLRDSLGQAPTASDFVLAGQDLAALFVDPAVDWLERHGCPVRLRTPVREIRVDLQARPHHGYLLRAFDPSAGEQQLRARHLVLATPPWTAARLLADLAPAASLAPLEGFGWRPITTAYVGWRAGNHALPTRLPPVFSLVDAQGKAEPAHWYFDRGRRAGWHLGALVISDSGEAMAQGEEALRAGLQKQLATALSLPPAEHIVLIHEKRATFSCTDDRPLVTPGSLLPQLPGVALAGDYSYGGYPATLEGAVRSGRMAAEIILSEV